MRTKCYFKTVAATARAINEETPTTVHAANIAKAAVLNQSLALRASNRPTVVEAGADVYIDGYRTGGSNRGNRHAKTDSDTQQTG
jgi:hypothetical protein